VVVTVVVMNWFRSLVARHRSIAPFSPRPLGRRVGADHDVLARPKVRGVAQLEPAVEQVGWEVTVRRRGSGSEILVVPLEGQVPELEN